MRVIYRLVVSRLQLFDDRLNQLNLGDANAYAGQ
jgi:hypothetical protein